MAITLGKLQPGASSPLGVGVSIKYVSWFSAVESFSASRGGMVGIGNTGTVNARMVVYADNAGVPGALLGQSDPRTFTDGTFTGAQQFVFSTPISVVAGTKYWIGSHSDGALSFPYDTLASASYFNLSNPDTFSDGASNPFLTAAGGLGTSSQLSVWLSDGGPLLAETAQVAVEVLRFPTAPKAEVSQVAVETLRAAVATAMTSQVVVELLRANGVEQQYVPLTVTPNHGIGGTRVRVVRN